ncbi:MAG: four helix bundle protein [Burkholderiales bacterium]
MARPHENLHAWREAMQLVKVVYTATRSFPKEELFGLTSQMRRSAISIPSNIAEGPARAGRRELAQFLNIAKGSLSELETQLLIAAELGYLDPKHEIFQLLERVARLVTGFHRKAAGST